MTGVERMLVYWLLLNFWGLKWPSHIKQVVHILGLKLQPSFSLSCFDGVILHPVKNLCFVILYSLFKSFRSLSHTILPLMLFLSLFSASDSPPKLSVHIAIHDHGSYWHEVAAKKEIVAGCLRFLLKWTSGPTFLGFFGFISCFSYWMFMILPGHVISLWLFLPSLGSGFIQAWIFFPIFANAGIMPPWFLGFYIG